MNRTPMAILAAAWLLSACAHKQRQAAPMPAEAEAPVSPITEAEVRAFLDAEADEQRAAVLADSVVDEEDTASLPIDPADFDIPIHYTERVQFWMDYFQGRGRERFRTYLERMGRYEPLIRSELRRRGMPEDLIYLALIESGFSPVARSHASAVGLWQFIAGTARRYGLEVTSYVDERRDPVRATAAALSYLQALHRQFGSWYLAAAAYNTGEHRVERILREEVDGARGDERLYWQISPRLHSETRNYVPKLIAVAILARYRDRYGFGDVEPLAPQEFDLVTIPDATEFSVIAEAAGVSDAEIDRLNPQFPRRVTPPGREVQVRVPAGRGQAFTVAYAKIPPSQRVRVLEHTVRRGETLSEIARMYGTTVAALQANNRIRNPHTVSVGKRLVIRMGGRGSAPAATTSGAGRSTATAGTPAGTTGSGAAAGAERAAPGTVYRVRKGDSLWSIAQKHGVSVDDLRSWNRIGARDRILPGQRIVIRAGERIAVYRVRSGDTLWEIARRHGITTDRLLELNDDMEKNAVLRPGDEVSVPLAR